MKFMSATVLIVTAVLAYSAYLLGGTFQNAQEMTGWRSAWRE
ncbi:MAG: hypothetical protein ABIS18_11470 [Actinomycetota bacterium]